MNIKFDNVNSFRVKKIGFFLLLCYWLVAQGCYSSYLLDYNSNYKKKVGILPLQNISNIKPEVLQDLFSQSSFANNILNECPNALIIGSDTVGCPDFLISPPINEFGTLDNAALIKLGREVGLAGIAFQSIHDIGTYSRNKGFLWFKKNKYFFRIRVTATILDVVTGTILYKHTEEIDKIITNKSNDELFLVDNNTDLTMECLSKAFLNISSKLGSMIGKTLSKREWVSTFVSVTDVNADIPLGKEVGIALGDSFSVLGVERMIYGPGGELYLVPGKKRIGKFTIISTYDGYSHGMFEGTKSPKVNDIIIPLRD